MADAFSLTGRLGLDARDFSTNAKRAASDLEDVEKALEEVDGTTIDLDTAPAQASLDDLSASGSGVGSDLGDAIAGGFAAAGVGAVIAAGLNEAMNIEAGQDRVQAQFALTAEEAEKFGKMGGELYADAWGESTEQTTAALANVNRSLVETGHVAEDELQGITKNALALSDTFDQDVDAVIRSVSQLMLNGLAPDAETAMDQVTAAFQQGGDKAGDLLDTIDEYSQHWAAFGISGDEALGMIVTGFENGQRDADKMADAIKEMRIRTVEDSDAISSAYAELGLDADTYRDKILAGGDSARTAFGDIITALQNVEDPTRKNALAVELIGTMYEDLGPTALDILGSVDQGLGDVTGSAEELADTVSDNTAASFESLKREAMQNLAETMTSVLSLTDALNDIANLDFSGAGQSFQDAFGSIGNSQLARVADPTGLGRKIGSTLGSWARGADDAGDSIGDMGDQFGTVADTVLPEFRDKADAVAAAVVKKAGYLKRAADNAYDEAEALRFAREAGQGIADDTPAVTGQLGALADELDRAADEAARADVEFGELVDNILGVQDANIDAETATRQLRKAVEAAKESTAGMDAETRKGRTSITQWTDAEIAAYDQALQTAGAISEQEIALREAGGETLTAKQRTDSYKAALGTVASQMSGPMKTAILNLIDDLDKLDATEAKPEVKLSGTVEASTALAAIQRQIDNLPNSVTIPVVISQPSGNVPLSATITGSSVPVGGVSVAAGTTRPAGTGTFGDGVATGTGWGTVNVYNYTRPTSVPELARAFQVATLQGF